MSYIRFLILIFTTTIALPGWSACSVTGQSDSGVARVSDTISGSPVQLGSSTSGVGGDTQQLTDEEIVTLFASCMRDKGFDVPDPELTSDGTVKWDSVKGALGEEAGFNAKSEKGIKALDECLPLLEGITRADKKSTEDETELKDNLLKFARCLRDHGMDVSDPDFDDPRPDMKSMISNLKGAKSRVETAVGSCEKQVFGSTKSEK